MGFNAFPCRCEREQRDVLGEPSAPAMRTHEQFLLNFGEAHHEPDDLLLSVRLRGEGVIFRRGHDGLVAKLFEWAFSTRKS